MTSPEAGDALGRNDIQSPWLIVPEAAKYARCGRTTIYNACRTGELRAASQVQSGTGHG